LVAPFVEVLATLHFESPPPKVRSEVIQDISRRAVSFFASDPELLARLGEVRSVSLEGPRGFFAILDVARAHTRRLRPEGPVRVALEFAEVRPAFRPPPSLRRVADGYYAPASHAEALQMIRAILGFDDGSSAERRATERIRVPLEQQIVVRFEAGGHVLAEALLADAAPRGLACYMDDPLEETPERVTLLWRGRELLTRRVESLSAAPVTVRGRRRIRVRVLVEAGGTPMRWDLPTWAGAREFGTVRPPADAQGTSLVQAALLARDEITVEEAVTPEDLQAARDLSYDTYVEEGEFIDPAVFPRSMWADEFDPHSIVLVARAGGMLAGTIRLVRETDLGLPHRHWSPAEAWPERVGTRVEAGRLAVSKAYRPETNARLAVATLLISSGFERCLQEGVDRVVMAAKIEHERFYRAVGFRSVARPFPHGLSGVVVRLFEMDLRDPGCLRQFLRLQTRLGGRERDAASGSGDKRAGGSRGEERGLPTTPPSPRLAHARRPGAAMGIHVRPVEEPHSDEDLRSSTRTITAFRDNVPAGSVRVICEGTYVHPVGSSEPRPGPPAVMRIWVDPADPDPDRVVSGLLATVGAHLARQRAQHALAMVDVHVQRSLERLGFHSSARGDERRVLMHAVCWDVALLRRAEPDGPDDGRRIFLVEGESLVEEGGPLGSLYQIVRGSLDLREGRSGASAERIGRLGRGDIFGAPRDGQSPPRIAVARGDCEVRVLSEPTVLDYARRSLRHLRQVTKSLAAADSASEHQMRGPVGVRLFNHALAARVVHSLHEIGLLRWAEANPRIDPAAAASTLGVEPEVLAQLLRFLSRLGLVRTEGLDYSFDKEVLESLQREMGFLQWLLGAYGPVLDGLTSLLRGRARYGAEVRRNDAIVAAASTTISREFTDTDLFEQLRMQGVESIADIGCGSALRLVEICRRFPYVRGTGVDLSADCCAVARANVAEAGLSDRIQIIQASASEWLNGLRSREGATPDLVMCCAMFHDLAGKPGAAESFLRETKEALGPGRYLLIQDQNRLPDDEPEGRESWCVGFELIHHLMGQRLFTRREYENLFEGAGWKVTRLVETPIQEGWIYLLEVAAP
jgi:SAM-dependent methyltransferase/N-acyl-L-homoserine lactone synthetase